MADREIRIAVTTTSNTAGIESAVRELSLLEKAASVSESGAADLDAALRQTAPAAEKLQEQVVRAGTGMKNMGMVANQASYQIGDFFTQVSMGQGAMRAFSMQAPQMIGAFQMAGMVTGPLGLALAGVAAVLPLVAMGFSALTRETHESTEALDEVAKAAGERAATEIKKAADEAHAAAEAAAAAVQNWDALKAAQAQATTAALGAEERMLTAREALNAALGRSIDLTAEKMELDRRQRETAAVQQMQAAMDKSHAATAAAIQAAQLVNRLEAETEAARGRAVASVAEMQRLAAEIAALQSRQESMRSQASAYALGGLPGLVENRAERRELETRLQMLEEAFAEQKGAGQGLVETLDKSMATLREAQNAATKAAGEAEVEAAAAGVAVESIRTTLAEDTTAAEMQALAASFTGRAAELDAILDTVTAASGPQQQAVANLRQITADGTLAADEARQLADGASKLIGGLQTGFSQTSENQQRIIAMIQDLVRQQNADARRVEALEGMIKSPARPR